MHMILKTACTLALGAALSGCGAGGSSREEAASKAAPKTADAEQAAASIPATSTVPVTTASIGPGKYLASIQGMS